MFNKSNLKSGMKVELNNGQEYIVFINSEHKWDDSKDILVMPKENSHNWIKLSDYNEDLNCIGYSTSYTIDKIYLPKHPYDIFYNHNGWELIWDRNAIQNGDEIKIINSVSWLNNVIGRVDDINKCDKTKPLAINIEFKNGTSMTYFCDYKHVQKL